MEKCKNCGAIIQAGASNCINCGQIIENNDANISNNIQNNMKTCSSCGKLVDVGALFCNYCGQAFSAGTANNDVQPTREKKYSFRIRCMFVFFLFCSIVYFANGEIFSGIILGICGVLMSPPLLKRNAKWITVFVFIVALLAIFMGCYVMMEKDEKINMVKSGSFNSYVDIEIEDAFCSFFSDCEWEYIDNYVEFRGRCYVGNEIVPVVMRFYFETEDKFVMRYLAIDGMIQNAAGIGEMIDIIYDSYFEEQGL